MTKRITCLVAGTALCLAGCATPKYVSTSFDPQKVDRLVLLPFIDNCVKPDPTHDYKTLCDCAKSNIKATLEERGYRVLESADVGDVAHYSSQDLPKGDSNSFDPVWIKQLGPSSDRWVLVPVFDDLSYQSVAVGFSSKVTISVYLFDKENGELSVKNDASWTEYIGVLGQAMMRGQTASQKNTVSAVAIQSVNCIPKRKSSYGKATIDHQESLDSTRIDKITILEVADGRNQVHENIDFEKETSMIQSLMIACLKQKGYECAALKDRSAMAMSAQQVPFAESSQIRKMGPEEAQWVMVPIVENLNKTKGSGSNCTLSCYLFDKSAGRLAWENSASRNTVPLTIFQQSELDVKGTVRILLEKFPAKTHQ